MASAAGDVIPVEIPATEAADVQLLTAVFSQLVDAGLMWKIFEFGKEHAHMVSDGGRSGADTDPVAEYSLETHEAHGKFCAMVEGVLEEHIVNVLGISLEDFASLVERNGGAQEGTDGERLLSAVESLTNFDVFCDLMKSIDWNHDPRHPSGT